MGYGEIVQIPFVDLFPMVIRFTHNMPAVGLLCGINDSDLSQEVFFTNLCLDKNHKS